RGIEHAVGLYQMAVQALAPLGSRPCIGCHARPGLERTGQVRGRKADACGQLWQRKVPLPTQQFAGGGDQCVELLCRALASRRIAPARTDPCSFGPCRIGMEADVVAAWPPGRAARPAVDTGAAHGEYEASVERLVAFADGQP